MSTLEKKNKVTSKIAANQTILADKSDKFNKKKTESLNKLYKEIYDAGIQSKDAEDYMNSKK